MKNFGFEDETTVVAPGINAKMNEVQAAMGLLQLKYIDSIIDKRKKVACEYRNVLKNIKGLTFIEDIPGVKHCYSYFPILIDNVKFGKTREELFNELKKHNIFGRRYFYPLISQFPSYSGLESAQPGKMPIAERVTEQVICLPIYPDIASETISFICNIISDFSK